MVWAFCTSTFPSLPPVAFPSLIPTALFGPSPPPLSPMGCERRRKHWRRGQSRPPLTRSRRRKKNVGVKSARGEEGGLGGGREAAFLMRGPATNRSLGGNGGGGGGCGGDVGEGELGNNDTARKKRRDVGDGRLTPYSYKRVVICGRRGGGSLGILPG